MTQSNYEKFQQRVFDEITDMEALRKQVIVRQMIDAGKSVGIDIISEVLDHGRLASEVMKEIEEKKKSARS